MKYFLLLATLVLSQGNTTVSVSLPASISTSVAAPTTTSATTSVGTTTSTSSTASSRASTAPSTPPTTSSGSGPTNSNNRPPSSSGKPAPTSQPETQKESAPFALGSPLMIGVAAAVFAIIFAVIAFFVIRRRKVDNDSTLLDLRDSFHGKGPAPVIGGGATKILGDTGPIQTGPRTPRNPNRDMTINPENPATDEIAKYYSTPASAPVDMESVYDQPQPVQPVYTQREIDIWNAQEQYGMYTDQQVLDWATQMRGEGYSEDAVKAWTTGLGRTYTQQEIEAWYDLEYFPQSQSGKAVDARVGRVKGPSRAFSSASDRQG